MNPHLAEEHLQTIRLLMERSALYRRALAPIVLVAGSLGAVAAAVGLGFHLVAAWAFAGLWLGTACVAVGSSFLLARRQAFRDQEKFWTPPTFRVAQALLPPLVSGLALGLLTFGLGTAWPVDLLMALIWLLFYGCALHSAGFFMARGIKWFGWGFILVAILLAIVLAAGVWSPTPATANGVMGLTFGGLHLAYGIYLHFTEKKHPVA
jgi:hypothetical protein